MIIMKKINTNSNCQDTAALIDLFNKILEESNYDLNRFVNGMTLSIDDNESKDLGEMVQKFIDLIVPGVKRLASPEEFWEEFTKLDDYEKIDKFIDWIKGYTNSAIKPYEETKLIRNMDEQEFEDITKYCFGNLILQDVGKRKIQEQENSNQIILLKKVFLTFIDMVIVNNFSKDNAFYNMEKVFGLGEKKCSIWWNLVKENEDKLWKLMIMKKYNQIENKIDFLLNELEEANIIK